jgi:ABC-type polysaccharide/polyol phosphate transport system ATPase subunit
MSSSSVAVRLENVSKRYRAGRSRTVVDLIASTIDSLRGQERDVYSVARGRIDANVWALKDVTFDIERGSGIGIIGSNGAGKTTLLKLISRVTWPTSGRVQVAGRVVSLIELGAGFHPELTGRENVYLGGGLFGLSRRDIDRRFDEIVRFAEVERLIDTPMKRYSSGLYARLGFSVAIHSNPDIVLVDEVLAVGDAAFRRRALESLRRLIGEEKTVLFISHDMWNVRRLCSRILWMDEGRVQAFGPAAEIAEQYMSEVNLRALANQQTALQSHRGGTGEIRYTDIDIVDRDGHTTSIVPEGGRLVVRVGYEARTRVHSPLFQIAIVDVDTGLVVATATSSAADVPAVIDGTGRFDCVFEAVTLRRRQYVLRAAITDAFQLVSYDTVTAGPRFAIGAVRSAQQGADTSDEDDDGLVALPYRFEHHAERPAELGIRN